MDAEQGISAPPVIPSPGPASGVRSGGGGPRPPVSTTPRPGAVPGDLPSYFLPAIARWAGAISIGGETGGQAAENAALIAAWVAAGDSPGERTARFDALAWRMTNGYARGRAPDDDPRRLIAAALPMAVTLAAARGVT